MALLTRFARPCARLAASRATAMPVVAMRPMRMYSDKAVKTTEEVSLDIDDHLSYDEFTKKFERDFDEAYDLYEVQRVLNNAFSYDLVPAPTVCERALRAARRVNDYPTASRVFEALKFKVSTKAQYDAYLAELKDIREELGITLHEDLYADEA